VKELKLSQQTGVYRKLENLSTFHKKILLLKVLEKYNLEAKILPVQPTS
jgi:hypothetical protein